MTTTQAPTQEFLLPDVGEGLTEAEIVEWKVAVGDVIAINDIIVEIETAKSLVELPSPYAGTVLALMVDAGVTVDVGTPIIRVGDPASTGPSTGPSTGEPAPGPAAAAPQPEMAIDLSNPAASGGGEGESLVGRNKAERGPVRRARKGSASPSTEAGANTQMQLQGAFAPGGAES
ncbi:biotin/lipoyl-containing protein, partial [Nocardioides kribbensis]